METISVPPLKKVRYNKEYINTETSKQVVRSFNLLQQFPSRNSLTNDGMPQLLKFKSVDGKDLGEFKVISKNGMQIGKTIIMTKQPQKISDKNRNSHFQSILENQELDIEDSMLKLQSQYTTKAQFLPEADLKLISMDKQKQTTYHRPLILKKNVKSINKIQFDNNAKLQMIKINKPIVKDVKPPIFNSKVTQKVINHIPEQGKIIKSYTRTLKKIGPNMQLLPHDSPDAKTIINTVTEPVTGRNGTITFVQKPLIVNGLPLKMNRFHINGIKPNFSHNLTIIEEALSSLSDEQLRKKALKALEECKTENVRQVPAKPPQEIKSVSDSMVQTEVFAMMIPGEFIVTSSNSDILKRQKVQKNEHKDVNEVVDKSKFKKDLDEVLKDFGDRNECIEKTLEKKRSEMTKRIVKQLYEDYMSMKEFDEDGLLGIHQTVVFNDVKGVRRLLTVMKMMDVNADVKTRDGNTSLELAVECDVNLEIIEALLQAGGKPILQDPLQNSAISIASKKSSPGFPLLLRYVEKAQLNETDLEGFTCLHHCAQNGNIDGIKALLFRGIDVNLQDKKSGKTALFIAMENQYEDLVKLLISFDADPRIMNFTGQTILPLIDGMKSYALRTELHKALR